MARKPKIGENLMYSLHLSAVILKTPTALEELEFRLVKIVVVLWDDN